MPTDASCTVRISRSTRLATRDTSTVHKAHRITATSSKKCSTSVRPCRQAIRGSEPATTSAITALFSALPSHPASASAACETTRSRGDDFGCQEVLLDKAAQTLGDALLVPRNDGRVQDQDPARVSGTTRRRAYQGLQSVVHRQYLVLRQKHVATPTTDRLAWQTTQASSSAIMPRANRSPSCACALTERVFRVPRSGSSFARPNSCPSQSRSSIRLPP